MAPQLDQGSQRRPQAVFFFFLSSLASSYYCLGMPQFWHRRSEVTRPQEPSRSFSPMDCHYDSPLTRVPVTRPRHSRHSHSHACEYAELCSRADAYFYLWRLLTGPRLLRNHSTWDDTEKPPTVVWGFSLTSTMTQYLLETWFFLTPHVKNANCPNSKHILWVLHFFSSVL